MPDDHFTRRVQEAGSRLAALADEALAANDAAGNELVQRLLHELATGIEELRVAEEELIVQGEQLAASHLAVDAERERYGRLFDFAPDAYIETDGLGKILEANAAASRLFGVPVRFLVNKLMASFVSDEHRRRIRALLTAAAVGDVTDGELRLEIVPRHGQATPVGVSAAAEVDPRDGELRVLWLLRDLTVRIKEEEERQSLQEEVDLLVALADVARLTDGDDQLGAVLKGLMDLACQVAEESTVSATVVGRHHQLTTAVAADDTAARLSDLQHRLDAGPCVEAARRLVATEVSVDEIEERWPRLAAEVRAEGFIEILGLPLVVDGAPRGALNVYTRTPTTAPARRALRLLADQASAAVANAELYESASTLTQQLTTALETRAVIEQAKGALMAMQKCSADEAFDILRRASQRQNQKLRQIAVEFIQRAQGPPAPQ